jgi:hypothetical protein
MIGAVGGAVSAFPLGVITNILSPTSDDVAGGGQRVRPAWHQFLITVVFGTLSGAIGAAVLHHNEVDLKGTDILHATRAGVLGGAIMGPGAIIYIPILMLVLVTILSPLFILTAMGVEWFRGSIEQTMTANSYSYRICYCVGTRGRDPEINEQVNRMNNIIRNHESFLWGPRRDDFGSW